MESIPDALLAHLLGMGFGQADIQACHTALLSSGSPITVQSVTERLLQRQSVSNTVSIPDHTPSDTPTLRLNDSSKVATSTYTAAITDQSPSVDPPLAPLKSRHYYNEEERRQRDRYEAKERDEAVKKARERRLLDHRAKELVKQKIAEDRLRRSEKKAPVAMETSTVNKSATPTSQCRVQVRLGDGSVLRKSLEPSSTLSDVCQYVMSVRPQLTDIQLVQPFPHREFKGDEYYQTLQELGLVPSASLVVSKNSRKESSDNKPEPMEVGGVSSGAGRDVPEDMEEGRGDSEGGIPSSPPPLAILPFPGPNIRPHPRPGPGRGFPPPLFPPPGVGGGLPAPVLPPFPPIPHPGLPQQGHQQPLISFKGEGHKLGGIRDSSQQAVAIEPQVLSRNVSEHALAAAEKRAKILKEMTESNKASSSTAADFPSLEVLTLRCLARWSSVNYLPSCSSLPPRMAHRLISSLASAKELHPKSLSAFFKCPLQMMVLDNYSYATNQLIEMLRYFSSLRHLSLVGCTLLTDKSMGLLLPYLGNLVHLSLNGCHSLSDEIFRSMQAYKSLEVLRLSKMKLSDEGMQLLLRRPLQSLRELDLSYTAITSQALSMLPRGTPSLNVLNVEATKVSDVAPLLCIEGLHTLNVSQCPLAKGAVGTLTGCANLVSLSLSQIPIDHTELAKLKGLNLSQFSLPDRNLFFDDHMTHIGGFPLVALDLTGYSNITDMGLRHIAGMTSLNKLSLSRTRLGNEGMIYLQELLNLTQLSLDNTLITDKGMECVRGLTNLEELSVSDTRVTSRFIVNGCLNKMNKLLRLNLVRTFVDDSGLKALMIPSLLMLSIDFTCATNAVTMETLRSGGCRSLELFRNHNICQPSEHELNQQRNNNQPVGHAHAQHYHDDDDDDSD